MAPKAQRVGVHQDRFFSISPRKLAGVKPVVLIVRMHVPNVGLLPGLYSPTITYALIVSYQSIIICQLVGARRPNAKLHYMGNTYESLALSFGRQWGGPIYPHTFNVCSAGRTHRVQGIANV